MPTPDQRYNALAYSAILEDISSSATEINLPVGGANAFSLAFDAGTEVWGTLTDVLGEIEVIKITNIEGDKLTVERGQDVTIAKPWLAGSVITQRLAAANMLQFDQKTVFRTIAFNPNGSMTANYPGEKVREISLDPCANRWWKNTFGTNWRLIAGIRCPGEIDDSEGYPQPFLERDIFIAGGGGTGGGAIQDTDGYEPDIDTWSTMSNMPVPARRTGAAFTLNLDFGYGVGGSDAGATYQILCDEYNLDVWAGRTPMPLPTRRLMTGFSLNNKGYSAGGEPNVPVILLADNDEFDSSGNSWASRTDMPETAELGAGGEINSKGYRWGGSIGGGPLTGYRKTNFEYIVDAWTSKTDLIFERGTIGTSAAVLNSRGYLFQGRAYLPPNTSQTDLNHEYDPVGDSWAVKTTLPAPVRANASANPYDNKAYVMSGRFTQPGPDELVDVDEYDPGTDSWASKIDHPLPKRQSTYAFNADGGL